MKISAVRVFVEDLAAARRFYGTLLELPELDHSEHHVSFDAGPILLVEKADDEARGDGLVGRFLGFSLQVDDLAAMQTRLVTAGCRIVGAPERQAWGGILMHVDDLSGNVVTFVQLP